MTARRASAVASTSFFSLEGPTGLEPLSLLRPISSLRRGAAMLGARAAALAPGLTLDPRFVPAGRIFAKGRPAAGFLDGRLAWIRGATSAEGLPREEAHGEWIRAPWDLVPVDDDRLAAELAAYRPGLAAAALAKGVHRAGRRIAVAKSARIDPGAFLDARNGPVVVAAGARVGANAVLEGPVLVDVDAIVRPFAHVRGSVLGRGVRAGGEIAASVIDDYSNKAHHGFLGHSYVGSWVNLGAGSTVSNLKNTYGEVTSGWRGTEGTGRVFFGCAIGDHAKIGIQVAIATGSLIGPGAHLVGAGPFPKVVPPLYWPDGGRCDPGKAVEIARRAMKRRGMDLSPAEAEALRTCG